MLKTSHEIISSCSRNAQRMLEKELGLLAEMVRKGGGKGGEREGGREGGLRSIEQFVVSMKKKVLYSSFRWCDVLGSGV